MQDNVTEKIEQKVEEVSDVITESSIWESFKNFLELKANFTEHISMSVAQLLIVASVVFIATIVLKIVLKVLTRKLPHEDKIKFTVVYGYFRWLIYLIILLITLNSVGVDVPMNS